MPLSEDEMRAVKHEALGGEAAAAAWNNALNALHAYAQQSKCLPGVDVVVWFDQRLHAYQDALSAAIRSSNDAGRAALEQGS